MSVTWTLGEVKISTHPEIPGTWTQAAVDRSLELHEKGSHWADPTVSGLISDCGRFGVHSAHDAPYEWRVTLLPSGFAVARSSHCDAVARLCRFVELVSDLDWSGSLREIRERLGEPVLDAKRRALCGGGS